MDEMDIPVLTEEDHQLIDDSGSNSDGQQHSAEVQATRWFRVALLALLAVIGSLAWHHVDKMQVVVPFVLVVEKTDNGQVTLVEPPTPMKDFVFPAESIMYMLGHFVVDRQRLGEDRAEMDDRRMNVEAAVCGPATQQIVVPPKREAALVAVNIETKMPTASPQTYRIGWQESWYDRMGYHKGDHDMVADITVARRELDWSKHDSMEIWRRHPMGLCVSSFLMHEIPKLADVK